MTEQLSIWTLNQLTLWASHVDAYSTVDFVRPENFGGTYVERSVRKELSAKSKIYRANMAQEDFTSSMITLRLEKKKLLSYAT